MKKVFLRSFLILSITLLFSSCAAGLTGAMSGSAALSTNNFTYAQKNIQGKSQATYVLGIGGMKREAIVSEAKENMLANYPLKDGQAVANVVVDFKQSFFLGIVITVKCSVSADVVEFK